MKKYVFSMFVGWMTVFCVALTGQALAKPSLKTLVLEPDQTKRKKGLEIKVVVYTNNPDGTVSKTKMPLSVATRRYYKSGEQVTFEVTSNHSGYLYVLHRDPKGDMSVLYPAANTPNKKNQKNRIKAMKAFHFPHGAKFTFRPPRGLEHLSFVVTDKKLFKEQLFSCANDYGFPAVSEQRRSDIIRNVETNQGPKENTNLAVQIIMNAKGHGKTLVMEADHEPAQDADYIVLPRQNLKPQQVSVLFVRFFFAHQ